MVSIGSAIFILTKVILWFTSLERHFISFIWRIWFITKIFYMVSKRIYETLECFKLRARTLFSLIFIRPRVRINLTNLSRALSVCNFMGLKP